MAPTRTAGWRRVGALGAALVAAGVVCGLLAANSHRPAHRPVATPEVRSPVSTGGCAPLGLRLRTAAAHGQSLVTGYGRLAPAVRTVDGTDYRQFRLTGLRTVTGSSVPASLTAWLAVPPGRAAAAADTPGLWAPDGHLVALLTPGAAATEPIASIAPVVGERVILSAAGCWSDPALTGSRFAGRLAEVPGTDAYRLAQQAGGFVSCPLSDLSRLAGG